MNKYLLKTAGPALLALLFHTQGFAQQTQARPADQDEDNDSLLNRHQEPGEIIIRRKNDKDTKVTIEIRDGKVLVNGKPVSEFNDDNLSVIRSSGNLFDGQTITLAGPDGMEYLVPPIPPVAPLRPLSPFRNQSGARSTEGLNGNRAFLGVTSGNAEKEGAGALVREISPGSAAEKAGLKKGDLITRIDETTITGPESLSKTVRKYKPEDKIALVCQRDGKEQKATIVLGKSKTLNLYNYRYETPLQDYNSRPQNFNFDYKMSPEGRFGWGEMKPRLGIKAQDTEDGKGVKVLDVEEESAAGKAGIKEGDLITQFDGKDVNSATMLAEQARASRGKASIHIGLIRDGKSKDIEVKTPRKLKTADL